MKGALVVALLFSFAARAEDTLPIDVPSLEPVRSGKVELFKTGETVNIGAGFYINALGYKALNDAFAQADTDLVKLTAENVALQRAVDKAAATPSLSVVSVAILVGVGIVAGAGGVLYFTHR